MSGVTDEQRAAHIAALIRERDGYERYGRADRVAAVDEELRRLGGEGERPGRRATKLKREG